MSNVKQKKQNGIYYTPRPLSEILCGWAIRSPHDLILEPSFGGCVFIESILSALRKFRVVNAHENVFGCDTDIEAFNYLASAINNFKTKHFLLDDFLKLQPSHFGKKGFDVVIGNPPYVSLHNMPPRQRRAASQIQNRHRIIIDKRASLWAYFVVNGLNFLNQNGRLAFVMPGSLIHSEYGVKLLHQLGSHFSKLAVVSIEERYFKTAGADESTELLLCEGWGNGPACGGIEITSVKDTSSCRERIKEWQCGDWRGKKLNGEPAAHLIHKSGGHGAFPHNCNVSFCPDYCIIDSRS